MCIFVVSLQVSKCHCENISFFVMWTGVSSDLALYSNNTGWVMMYRNKDQNQCSRTGDAAFWYCKTGTYRTLQRFRCVMWVVTNVASSLKQTCGGGLRNLHVESQRSISNLIYTHAVTLPKAFWSSFLTFTSRQDLEKEEHVTCHKLVKISLKTFLHVKKCRGITGTAQAAEVSVVETLKGI